MVIEHRYIELFGKKVFEKAVVTSPFKNPNPLPNEACFLYVLEGSNNSYSEQEHIVIQQDEGALMKCGNYLYDGRPDEDTGQCGLLAIHFYPDVLKKIYHKDLPEFLQANKPSPSLHNMAHLKANELIKNYINGLLQYLDAPDLCTEELVILKLKEIILLLLRTDNAPKVREIMNHLFSPKAFTLKEVVESHIFSPITVADLARLTNHSLASFKRAFRRIYKDSPARYIKHRRLEKAAEYLLVSDASVSTIAYDCQFNNVAHFSSSFKDKYQLSPSEFRMSQRRK